MTDKLQRYPFLTVAVVYVAMAAVYAMALAVPGGFVERLAEGVGALFPALIVGIVMARSASKKGNPYPVVAGLKGVVIVAGLVMGFLWFG